MSARFALVMACVCAASLNGCGRINLARVNSDMTDEKIGEVVSKRLQPGMSIEEVQDRAGWLRFHERASFGVSEIAIDPDWLSRDEVRGLRNKNPYGSASEGRELDPPSFATSTARCIQWRLENSGFIHTFMIQPSREFLYAVFDENGRLGALFRTEMYADFHTSDTDVLRRIPLTPEPAP